VSGPVTAGRAVLAAAAAAAQDARPKEWRVTEDGRCVEVTNTIEEEDDDGRPALD
jgi:hypothetical protein